MFILSEYIFTTYKNRSETWIQKKDPQFHSFIFSQFDIEITWREKLYLYHYNLSIPPSCYCGKRLKFIDISKGYRQYCSNSCKANDPELLEITKQRNIEKFGVDNPMKSSTIKEKQKSKLKEKYGVDNAFQIEKVRQKVLKTNREKWGVDYLSQLPDKRQELSQKMKLNSSRFNTINKINLEQRLHRKFNKLNLHFITIVETSIYLACCKQGHEFRIHKNMLNDRTRNKNTICTICNPIKSGSDGENQLYQFAKSIYSGTIIRNYRDTYEIDIFLPDFNIGFEFNGIYWHSSIYRDKFYHRDKLKYFADKGIEIFYVWEDEWLNNDEIVKAYIKTILAIKDNCEDIRYIEYPSSKDGIVRCDNTLLAFILKSFGFRVIRTTEPYVEFISNTKRLKLELNKTFSPVRVSEKINFIWMNGIEILSLRTV